MSRVCFFWLPRPASAAERTTGRGALSGSIFFGHECFFGLQGGFGAVVETTMEHHACFLFG